ncbi:MAG: SlyX family protein [Opitutaceae bacterium]
MATAKSPPAFAAPRKLPGSVFGSSRDNARSFFRNMADDERLTRLEERYTHLQHHVTEQDKVMLAMNAELDRLRQELTDVRAQLATAPQGEEAPGEERPPHY